MAKALGKVIKPKRKTLGKIVKPKAKTSKMPKVGGFKRQKNKKY